MEYSSARMLHEIIHLLERLDRGDSLSKEEQAELDAIRSLNGFGFPGKLPTSIGTLTALKSLDLYIAQITDLSPLADLTALESLALDYAPICDITPLANLTALKQLSLRNTLVRDISPLKRMAALKTLDLSWTQVKDLSPLAGLTALNSLYLDNTPISDLTPLRELTALDALHLGETLVSDLSPLKNMTALETLHLPNTQVHDLSPLSALSSLRYLNLCHTPVRDLTPLTHLTALEDLDLGRTAVHDLSPLTGLGNLARLDLSYCNLWAIPRELYDTGLPILSQSAPRSERSIILHQCTLSTQPISIFSESSDVTDAYYNTPKVKVRESKVIFLGDGGAGKTHTIKRILAGGSDDDISTDTTLGISINRHTVTGKNGPFDINFWDFGGQENMHALHRCFLTERTLYVLIINNRWDLNTQARYWLNNVRSFAPDAPVILAVNLWEGIHQFALDTTRILREYPNVKIQLYTAKGKDKGNFRELTGMIIEQAEQLDSCAMELPENWAAILTEVREMAKSDEWYLDREKYHEICANHGLGDHQHEIRTWLLEWLNDLGVCFSYHRDKQSREELGAYKVLDPRWLTSAIYILLNAKKKYYLNGTMPLGSIETLLENPKPSKLDPKDHCDYILDGVSYDEKECQYILKVMRKFGLSYPIDENAEFIPALCDSKMPDDLHPTEYQSRISYEFRYSFLPDSVVQRLMTRLYGIKKLTKCWRKGFRFEDSAHDLIAVVDAGGPNDMLRLDVYARSENKGRNIMAELITHIAAVNLDLNMKADEYIIVHGDRGEIPTPADMILSAKEQNIPSLYLYSKENRLIERNIDDILGYTYGPPRIIEAAQDLAHDQQRSLSEAMPHIINNYSVYVNFYNNATPGELQQILEKLVQQNYQVSQEFTAYLLNRLSRSENEPVKELAEKVEKTDSKGSIFKRLLDILKNTADATKNIRSIATDGKELAKPVMNALIAAAAAYGPQILEFLSQIQPAMLG